MEDKKKEKLYLKYNKYFPTKYVDNILDITSEELIENGIKGVILDLDNTIIDNKALVKAKEMMEIKDRENIAVIGDQVFTDVLRRK